MKHMSSTSISVVLIQYRNLLLTILLVAVSNLALSVPNARYLGVDAVMKGSFNAIENRYFLCAWDNGTDVDHFMPDRPVTPDGGVYRRCWATNQSEARAVRNPDNGVRNAACWYASNSLKFNITIDTSWYPDDDLLARGRAEKMILGLYCLDWDNGGREQTINIKSINGVSLLNSSISVTNYTNGKWYYFEFNDDISVEILNVTGADAVVSAITIRSAPNPNPAVPYWGWYDSTGYDSTGPNSYYDFIDRELGSVNDAIDWDIADQQHHMRQFNSNLPEWIRSNSGVLWKDSAQGRDQITYHGYLFHVLNPPMPSGTNPMKKRSALGILFKNTSNRRVKVQMWHLADSTGGVSKGKSGALVYQDLSSRWNGPTPIQTIDKNQVVVLKYWTGHWGESPAAHFRIQVLKDGMDNQGNGPVRCILATVVCPEVGNTNPNNEQIDLLITTLTNNPEPISYHGHPRGSWMTSHLQLSNLSRPVDIDNMSVSPPRGTNEKSDVTLYKICAGIGDPRTGYSDDIVYRSTSSFKSNNNDVIISDTNRSTTNDGSYGVYTNVKLYITNSGNTSPEDKRLGIYIRKPNYPNLTDGVASYIGAVGVNSVLKVLDLGNDIQIASECLVKEDIQDGIIIRVGDTACINVDIMHVGPAMLPIYIVVKRLE